jgi:hypothetical protein
VNAGLELAQGRDIRIRMLIRRHAPDWASPSIERPPPRVPHRTVDLPHCNGPGLLLPRIADWCEIGRTVVVSNG